MESLPSTDLIEDFWSSQVTSSFTSESNMNFLRRTKLTYQRRQSCPTDRGSGQTLGSPGYAIATLGALRIDVYWGGNTTLRGDGNHNVLQ